MNRDWMHELNRIEEKLDALHESLINERDLSKRDRLILQIMMAYTVRSYIKRKLLESFVGRRPQW